MDISYFPPSPSPRTWHSSLPSLHLTAFSMHKLTFIDSVSAPDRRLRTSWPLLSPSPCPTAVSMRSWPSWCVSLPTPSPYEWIIIIAISVSKRRHRAWSPSLYELTFFIAILHVIQSSRHSPNPICLWTPGQPSTSEHNLITLSFTESDFPVDSSSIFIFLTKVEFKSTQRIAHKLPELVWGHGCHK